MSRASIWEPLRTPATHSRIRTASSMSRSSGVESGGSDAVPACACGGQCPRCMKQLNGGNPLDTDLARHFGALLGADLSGARIHADTFSRQSTESIGARAYTQGDHIFLSANAASPSTSAGRRLLAHELIHTVQQSKGETASQSVTRPDHASEGEARTGADRLLQGQPFRPTQAAKGLLQREEDEGSESADTSASCAAPNFDLEIFRKLRDLMADWLARQIGNGSASAPLSVPAADPAADASPQAAPGLNLALQMPFGAPAASPDYFSPLPPDPTYQPPDYSSIYSPYNTRGLPLPGRESTDFIDSLYRPRWHLVASLPDLRSEAPAFMRDLIPLTWRRDLASALTGLTVDAALKGDHATAIEAADRALVEMTGNPDAAPIYINPPFPPFKWSF